MDERDDPSPNLLRIVFGEGSGVGKVDASVTLLVMSENSINIMTPLGSSFFNNKVTEASTLPIPEPEAGVDHIPTKVRMMSLLQTESSDFATPPVQGNGRTVLL